VVRGTFPPECGEDTVAWKGKVEIEPTSLMKDTTVRLVAVDPVTRVTNQPSFKPAEGEDLERLRTGALKVLADSAEPLPIRQRLADVEGWHLSYPGTGKMLAGTFKADAARGNHSVSLFLLVATSQLNGKLTGFSQALLAFNRATEPNREEVLLYDVIDLDGDSVPELVAESRRYEGTNYKIYGYRNGRWSVLYESPYSGC